MPISEHYAALDHILDLIKEARDILDDIDATKFGDVPSMLDDIAKILDHVTIEIHNFGEALPP